MMSDSKIKMPEIHRSDKRNSTVELKIISATRPDVHSTSLC